MRSSRRGGGFDLQILHEGPGILIFQAAGKTAEADFAREGGGIRFQRVPPTEKRGRVHSSTITVAVLPEPSEAQVRIDERDLLIRATTGSGAGGQHRNKTASAVQITHLPTGLQVRVESERSQHQNKAAALALLRAKLLSGEEARSTRARNADRRGQVGSGERSDKVRTVALQRDQVIDHVTGRQTTAKRYLRGELADLWP